MRQSHIIKYHSALRMACLCQLNKVKIVELYMDPFAVCALRGTLPLCVQICQLSDANDMDNWRNTYNNAKLNVLSVFFFEVIV